MVWASEKPNQTIVSKMSCELTSNTVSLVYKNSRGDFLSCDQVKSFSETIDRVAAISPVAPAINLFIEREHSNASFDMGLIIRVPLRLTFSGPWGQVYYGQFISSHSVMAHEYGHAIFSKMLEEQEFFKEMKEESVSFSQKDLELMAALNSGVDQKEVELIKAQREVILKSRTSNKEHARIRRILGGYDELFADVVAVYAADNKRTMVNALFFNEISDQAFELVMARDFSGEERSFSNALLSEEHATFAQTRSFIGNNLWPSNDDEKKKFLSIVFDSILENVIERIKSPVDEELSARELNENLIDSIKQRI